MKKLAIFALLAGTMALGQTKKVVASEINWWGYKLVKAETSSHNGTLDLKSGNIAMKGNNIVGGTFVFDMNTIDNKDLTGEYHDKLNGHLKNGDFFEVEKYPTASFTITSVKANSNKIYNSLVTGNLTIKGIDKVISFPAKVQYSKGILNLVSDKFSFDRQKFGIAYKSTMQDVLLKDDIDMQVKVTAK